MNTKPEPYYAALDTEDDGKGSPYLFAIVHGRYRRTFSGRNACQLYLAALSLSQRDKGKTLYVWCTNLEYDLVNLFGADIKGVSLTFGKSSLVGARWKEGKVIFRDTVRHIPSSVKELGLMVGLEKLDDKGRGKRYCIRDASITLQSALVIADTYKPFGISPKCTLPSTAYNIWLKNFWQKEVIETPEEIREAAKAAYYGGRTEPFAIGEFGPVTVIDAASMFPYAMRQPFPLPWGDYERVTKGAEIKPYGVYKASIASYVDRPLLPVRSAYGIIYPNGRFTGWYIGEELLHFLSGRKGKREVKILGGYAFREQCEPFNGYVDTFFRLKQKSRGALRVMYKLLLNGLYGKFGQSGTRTVAMPLDRFMKMPNRPDDFRYFNGLALYQQTNKPPPWSNVVWSAFVTARARVRLNAQIERIEQRNGRTLYCDTDSIVYSGGRVSYPKLASNPGDFENRGRFPSILIVGKKEYGLRRDDGTWEVHVKGIPGQHRERYLRTGTATFSRPVRIRESSRRDIAANVWIDVTKERRVNYRDRQVLKDGTLLPIVINQKEESR